MSILNREQLSNSLKTFLGDNVSDEAIKLTEDVLDTFDDLNGKAYNPDEFVPKKELDRTNEEWAKKYRDRFFEPTPSLDKKDEKEKEKENNKPLTFENLFKTE